MNLRALLDTDMTTLGQLIRQGLAWWIDELAALAPPAWRGAFSSRPRIVAERTGEGYRLRRDGRDLGVASRPSKPLRIALAMPSERVLTREVAYPPLPQRDLKRIVGLDIDRLTPFHPDAVHFDLEALAPEDGRRTIRLGVVTRAAAAEAVAHARAWGLEPGAVGLAGGRFDFLPSIQAAEGAGSASRRQLYWWGAVAGLLSLNLAVFVARDVVDVESLRRTVESQRPGAEAALRLRQRVEGEHARRAALLVRRLGNEPLRVVDAATRALTREAWVQRLDWGGKAVRLAGYTSGGYDVLAALRASRDFADARSMASDIPAKLSAGQPFDAAADLRPSR